MKKIFVILFLILPLSSEAQSLRQFLSTCAWGVIGGTTAGVVSLALVDKPNESWNNVAKGASLGLYVGIGYGLYKMNQAPETRTYVEPSFSLAPRFENEKISGLDVSAVVYKF